MTTTPARLLELLSLLQSRRDWTATELAGRLGVTSRTVRRDVERLRALGYPVGATRGSIGGYRLEAGAALPPLLLDDDEAVAIVVGLGAASAGGVPGLEEHAVRALTKLEQVLPTRLRRRVAALRQATVAIPPEAPPVDPAVLTTLATAAVNHERLAFAYRARTGTESSREVEPYQLVFALRRWYLVAYDLDRADWRLFRADRVSDPRPTGARFGPRRLPAPDAATYAWQSVSSPLARYRTAVKVHAPAAAVAERISPNDGVLEPIDDDACVFHTGSDSIEWLASRLLALGADFEVHEPPELVDHLAALHGRTGRAIGRTRAGTP